MLSRTIISILLCIITPCSMAFGKLTVSALFKDRAMVTIDGTPRMLTIGKPSPEGVKLISANSREAVLEIDGEQKTYALGTEISSTFKGPPPGETVTIAPDDVGMYLVNGSINGFQVDFVVDTGATLVSMNKHQAKRIGLDYKMRGVEGVSETAAGYAKIYLVTLNEVKVGNITLHDVDAAVHDEDFPTVPLLGNSFLGRVNMVREGMLLQIKDN